MSTQWTGLGPLPKGGVQLLEASAGTGKTWQIEALVVRLVAEEAITIERILVMTFTEAATAELQDRVRRRLAAARDALAPGGAAPEDPILHLLWADEARRGERHDRVRQALANFDQAAISTIHGFASRVLAQLAFESGQEPGLELLADRKSVLGELVADELARSTADASDTELAVLEDQGWTRESLQEVGEVMCGAAEPAIEPAPAPGAAAIDPLESARAWVAELQAMSTWLASAEAEACVLALEEELKRELKSSAGRPRRRLTGRYLKGPKPDEVLEDLRAWLTAGGSVAARRAEGARHATVRLSTAALREHWAAEGEAPEHFAAFPLFRRVSELTAAQDRRWPVALADFARRIRGRLHAELERRGRLTYDTMLSKLAERVLTEGPAGPMATALRERFEVALVDEFQDTDAAQWAVLAAAFACPERRLFLVGDPKQAIYAFRDADVNVYLQAARAAAARGTMTCNRRSDAPYVAALNHVFGTGEGVFELAGVDYVPVTPHHASSRLQGAPRVGDRERRPLELRWLEASAPPAGAARGGATNKGAATDATTRSCVREVVELLGSGLRLTEPAAGTGEGSSRPVQPSDIAILVRTNRQGSMLQRELERAGVRAVRAADGSVFQSDAAGALAALLDALAAPRRDQLARTLAVSPLFGWDAEALVHALEARAAAGAAGATSAWDGWIAKIEAWSRSYARAGFLAALEAAVSSEEILPRLLQQAGGERLATDLRHLAELCHAEERRTRAGPAALAAWVRARGAEDTKTTSDELTLRLESDAQAVQIATVHKCKGLEYPIVLVPFAWEEGRANATTGPLRVHRTDAAGRARVVVDLHPPGVPARELAQESAQREERQQELRLLYVALTRARHACVAWLGPVVEGVARTPVVGPLSRVLARHAGEPVASSPETLTLEQVEEIARRSGATVGVAAAQTEPLPRRARGGDAVEPELRARPWARPAPFDERYRITSFSSLVGGLTVDPDEPVRDHDRLLGEPPAPGAAIDADDALSGAGPELASLTSPEPQTAPLATAPELVLAAMRGGKDIGTWVHAVLEQLDFAAAAGPESPETLALLGAAAARHGVADDRAPALLARALPGILDTPLDGAATGVPEGFALRRLARRERLDELEFDLRVGAGRRYRPGDPVEGATIDASGVAAALAARADREPGWAGAGWARAVVARHDSERSLLPSLAGILTGSIDLVFRAPASAGHARYYVADYKTNRIAARARPGTTSANHYGQPWLAWEMARHGYPLQALLYTLALHRLLAQRLGAAYDYDRHVGGYYYLFLRGMTGADTPRDGGLALGVSFDRWPRETILAVDAALCGEATAQPADREADEVEA
ncbi:MAG: UvrD-helicase domain-containing protein [Polyangiaceae bacterium]|nr:UvrD-helicase domain-containing protein [Polyangiaceae bacterium]